MPLFFPGSDEAETPDPTEVKFRDGTRHVAPYLVTLMGVFDTERLTYQEALDVLNRDLLNDHVGQAQARMVEDHLRDWGL